MDKIVILSCYFMSMKLSALSKEDYSVKVLGDKVLRRTRRHSRK
jgi:hypothetical protein